MTQISSRLRGLLMVVASAAVAGSGLWAAVGTPPRQTGVEVQHIFWHPATGELPPAYRPSAAMRAGGGAPSPKDLALDFVRTESAALRVSASEAASWTVSRVASDAAGASHVTLQQTYDGIKVFGGQLIVHLQGEVVTAVNGEVLSSAATITKPVLTMAAAEKAAALALGAARYVVDTTDVVVFNPALLDAGIAANELAFKTILRDASADVDDTHTVIVSALTGKPLYQFSNREYARNRQIRELAGSQTLPGESCYTESGAEGTPSADCTSAFQFSGDTYNYFSSTHSRDSFNAAGAALQVSVRYGNEANAFWNGTRTVFGPGFATKDVVAHEWSHAVTQYSAGLIYSAQSGALNESMSDVFGAMVDRDDWLMGEDLPGGGAIRNLQNPNAFNQPAKVSDSRYYCGTGDNGGVHYNSGVPNHAAYLMSDGGTFNGSTIGALGRTVTERIFYRALTVYLTSGSNFADAYTALNSACADLHNGASSATCTTVRAALDAVELDHPACGTDGGGGGSGTPDSYEDDDVAARASAYGSAQNHTFHDVGDNDWVSFSVTAGQNIDLRTSGLESRVDTYLYLYSTNGTTILAQDDDGGGGLASRITYSPSATGTYYARARNYATSSAGSGTGYTLTVTLTGGSGSGGDSYEPDDSAGAASSIEPDGAAQTHSFHVAGDNDWSQFTASSGARYIILTEGLGTANDTYLYLYSSNGTTLLAADDDSGGGRASRIEWTAPAAGTYLVRVRHYSASVFGANTDYRLRITTGGVAPGSYEPNDAAGQATAVTVGTAQSHTFYRASDHDWMQFALTASAPTVVETLNLGAGSDTVLDVYGTDGATLIGSNDDNGGGLASRVAFTPSASGTYYARVRNYRADVFGTTASYDIRVTSAACTGGDSYEPDGSASASHAITANGSAESHTLVCRGDQDWVRFTVAPGGIYTLTTSALGSTTDTVMDLYDSDGTTRLVTDDDGGGGLASRIAYTSPSAGTRYARVRHFSSTAEGSTNTYALALTAVLGEAGADAYEDDDTSGTADNLTVQTGHNFHDAGDVDFESFAVTAGETYVVETYNLGARCDTVVEIFLSTNLSTAITSDDDSGGGRASRATFTASATGSVYVRTRHFSSSTYGAGTQYDIRVSTSGSGGGGAADAYETDDTAGASSVLGTTVQRHTSHDAGDLDWARFTATAGVNYVIATANLGPSSDTVLDLYSTDAATLLASNDDGGGGRASRLSWTPSSSGTYYVQVRQFSSSTSGTGTNYDLQLVSATGGDAYEVDNTAAQASTITVGQTQTSHTFHVAGDFDWVGFAGVAGTTYVIETLTLAAGVDTVIDLFDATGTTRLAQNDDYGGSLASRIEWAAPASATYLVRVRHFLPSAAGASLSYDLRVTGSSGCSVGDAYEPDNTPAQAGAFAAGATAQRHTAGCARDEDWVSIALTSGSRYRLSTSGLGTDSDTVVYLYASNGTTLLASNDDVDGTRASRIEFTATSTATHYAMVKQYNPTVSGSTTQYDLAFALLSSASADAFESDDTYSSASTAVSGTTQASHNFHQASDPDWIKFSATSGQSCTMETSALGARADTVIEYYGTTPTGSIVASDDDGGPGLASRLVRSVTATGTHYLRVRHYSSGTFGSQTGYDFLVTCAAGTDAGEPNGTAATATPLTVGTTATGHQFSTAGDVDWFSFSAAGGTAYVIETLDLGTSSDTYVDLYSTNATTLIRSDDDSGPGVASLINWTAPSSGTYYLRVRHFYSSSFGSLTAYAMRVRLASSSLSADAAPPLFAVATAAEPGLVWLDFEATGGAALKVEVFIKAEFLQFVESMPLTAGKTVPSLRGDVTGWRQDTATEGGVTSWFAPKQAEAPAPGVRFVYRVIRPLPNGKLPVLARLVRVAADGSVESEWQTPTILSVDAQPKIDSATPTTIAEETGGSISLQGSNFVEMPKVSLRSGASSVPLVDVALSVEGNAVTATVPAGTKAGIYKIRLENPDGSSTEFDGNVTITTGGSTCSYALSPSQVSLPAAGGTASVALTTAANCVWAATTGADWITVTSANDGTGSATVTLSASVNSTSAERTGLVTIGSASLQVTEAVPPTITVSPAALAFAATKNGSAGAITSVTGAQTVSVAFSAGSPAWTVSADQAWVSLSASSGTGTGTFTVSISDPTNVIAGSTSLSATITLASVGASNSPRTIAVSLSVDQTNGATTVAAIGAFDSPADNATNVVGAIAVTGWALDDIGVERVEIWRNCLTPIDSSRPGVCRNATPTGAADKVFIGNAAFVPGARTDIENNAQYSGYPQAYRAGWGYLLLTNALPNQTSGATEGGQGAVTLYAYVIDREGRYTELGTKTITLNNDNATVPFGAIDTPEQGGTITGALTANFGWAMTRRQNALGVDVPKCIARSRYRVYIDSVARTLTTDTNWFPNLVRSDLTAAYPGLCDSANSLAAYYIDVPLLGLTNGTHTIGWDVYDDNGTVGDTSDDNVAGIGSRFFNILVAAADAPVEDRLRDRPARRGAASDITALPATEDRVVRARVGPIESTVVTVDPVCVEGMGFSPCLTARRVNLPAGHRLVMDLGGPVSRGYLIVGDELRDLPIGATLDAAGGQFYWQPPVPFFGPFELVFVSGPGGNDGGSELRTNVSVVVTDPTAGGEPEITITSPTTGANPNPVITVTGTVRDPRAVSGTGITTVHVWAYRKDVAGVPPQFLGAATLNGEAYTLTTRPLQPGTYDLAVFAWVARTGTWAPAATVNIAVR